MHFCMKDGKDMKKTVEELADKVKTDGATSETIAKEAESVMNNQVRSTDRADQLFGPWIPG